MDADEADRVRWFACRRKTRLTVGDAQRKRHRNGLTPYRCPWCRQWHLGRPPSMRTLRQLADAIRTLGAST